MRVISGKYKNKQLKGFNINGTRPTMDRIKESMFAMIQNYLPNAVVLDLFAGSGSLGIEALSNNCKVCYLVDNNKIAINTIKENLKGIENAIVINEDFLLALKSFKIKFDIIFLDPPYNNDLINIALDKIYEYDLLNNGGIIVCEHERNLISKYDLLKNRKYSSKEISIFIKKIP